MRTRRLCGLALAVLALHALAWRLATATPPRRAPAGAGPARIVLASVPQPGRPAAPTVPQPAAETVHMLIPAAAPPGRPIANLPGATHAQARSGDPHGARPDRLRRPGTRTDSDTALHQRPGAGGALPGAPGRADRWPVYPTRPPPSATLHYALVQTGRAASAAGSADLDWQQAAGAYTLRLATAVDGRPAREWAGSGGFDAAGVAPLDLVERERGRDRRALRFDRALGTVQWSGAAAGVPVAPGAQDRWSWIAQLAAIAEAAAARGDRPAQWELQVAGLRGDLQRWTFRRLPPGPPPPELQGNELSTPGGQAPVLLHLLRDPERPYDLRIEAWLAPALHHLPAGLRMSTPPGPWSLSLWLRRS